MTADDDCGSCLAFPALSSVAKADESSTDGTQIAHDIFNDAIGYLGWSLPPTRTAAVYSTRWSRKRQRPFRSSTRWRCEGERLIHWAQTLFKLLDVIYELL